MDSTNSKRRDPVHGSSSASPNAGLPDMTERGLAASSHRPGALNSHGQTKIEVLQPDTCGEIGNNRLMQFRGSAPEFKSIHSRLYMDPFSHSLSGNF